MGPGTSGDNCLAIYTQPQYSIIITCTRSPTASCDSGRLVPSDSVASAPAGKQLGQVPSESFGTGCSAPAISTVGHSLVKASAEHMQIGCRKVDRGY